MLLLAVNGPMSQAYCTQWGSDTSGQLIEARCSLLLRRICQTVNTDGLLVVVSKVGTIAYQFC